MTNADLEQKLANAILLLKMKFPFHADLLAHSKISLDDRIPTACVFPSGRILLSPAFIADMTHDEVAFIIEHEIMYIYYKTNERSRLFYDHWVANVAHDLTINGELVERFGFERPPGGGLHWPDYEASIDYLKRQGIVHEEFKPIRDYSLEEMVALLTAFRKNIHLLPQSVLNALADAIDFPGALDLEKKAKEEESPNNDVWGVLDQLQPDKSESKSDACEEKVGEASAPVEEPPSDSMTLEEKIEQKWLGALFSGDAMSILDELKLFPNESPLGIADAEQKMKDLVRTVAARQETIDINAEMTKRLQNGGSLKAAGAGASTAGFWDVQILRGKYSDSWEMALQAWIDESAPPTRSWAHASRRGANRTDVVLPGRNRVNEEWMLNIILDVSGSMWRVLPAVLGHI